MTLKATCRCGESFAAPAKLAGKKAKCPSCGEIIQIPSAAPKPDQASVSKSRGAGQSSRNSSTSSASNKSTSTGNSRPSSSPRSSASNKRNRASEAQSASQSNGMTSHDVFDLGDLSSLEGDHDPLGIESAAAPNQQTMNTAPQHSFAHRNGGYGQQQSRSQNGSLIWILGIGGAIAALMLIAVVGVVVVWMMAQDNGSQDIASADDAGEVNEPFTPDLSPTRNSNSGFGSETTTTGAGGFAGSNSNAGFGNSGAPSSSGGTGNGFGSPSTSSTAGEGESSGFGSDPSASDVDNEEAPAKLTTSDPSMVEGLTKWFGGSTDLKGTRAVPDEDLVIYHYSWLCNLLPHLGHQDVFDEFNFDKRCIESSNPKPSRTIIPQFLNPADDRERLDDIRFPGFALTHFAGMSGLENVPNDLAADYKRSDPRAGIFGYKDVATDDEISDGLSKTIMIIGSGKLAAPWVIGGGATIRGAREPYFGKINGFGSEGLKEAGVIVVMADGSVRHLSAEIDSEVFKALCTTHGAEEVDMESSRIGPPQPDWFKP